MKLSQKRNILLLILFSIFLSASAQEKITLSGTVVDAQNKESLPFVNVGIVGSLTGSASNPEGNFSFDIVEEMKNDQVYFSAIGYKRKQIQVAMFIEMNGGQFELEPQSYGIEDIEVSTASKVIHRMIKDILENIEENYISVPYNMTGLYSEELYVENISSKKRDALVKLSDKKGYGSRDTAYEDLQYRFENVQRNFEVKDLYSGLTDMNNLLSLDILRTNGNVLDTAFLDAYELKSTTTEEGETIINYVLKNPDFHKTGDFHAKVCKGNLFIDSKRKALIKAEIQINSSLHSIHGRELATDDDHAYLKDVQYSFIVTWGRDKAGFHFDQISCIKEGTGTDGKGRKILSSLKILDVNTIPSNRVNGRAHYENMLSDPDFWLTFQ